MTSSSHLSRASFLEEGTVTGLVVIGKEQRGDFVYSETKISGMSF